MVDSVENNTKSAKKDTKVPYIQNPRMKSPEFPPDQRTRLTSNLSVKSGKIVIGAAIGAAVKV